MAWFKGESFRTAECKDWLSKSVVTNFAAPSVVAAFARPNATRARPVSPKWKVRSVVAEPARFGSPDRSGSGAPAGQRLGSRARLTAGSRQLLGQRLSGILCAVPVAVRGEISWRISHIGQRVDGGEDDGCPGLAWCPGLASVQDWPQRPPPPRRSWVSRIGLPAELALNVHVTCSGSDSSHRKSRRFSRDGGRIRHEQW
jgi:hypothetical protein